MKLYFFGKIVLKEYVQFLCEFKYRFVVDDGIDLMKYANGHNNQKHFTIRKFSHLRKKSFLSNLTITSCSKNKDFPSVKYFSLNYLTLTVFLTYDYRHNF